MPRFRVVKEEVNVLSRISRTGKEAAAEFTRKEDTVSVIYGSSSTTVSIHV